MNRPCELLLQANTESQGTQHWFLLSSEAKNDHWMCILDLSNESHSSRRSRKSAAAFAIAAKCYTFAKALETEGHG